MRNRPCKQTRNAQKPEAEWERVKPFIHDSYINQGANVNITSSQLSARYGFVVTARQLKSRFSKWGWRKKLENKDYQAMRIAGERLGDTTVFKIPTTAGLTTRTMPQVRKECDRAKKAGKKVCKFSYERAMSHIQKMNAKVYCANELFSAWPVVEESEDTDGDDEEEEDDDDDDDDESLDSDRPSPNLTVDQHHHTLASKSASIPLHDLGGASSQAESLDSSPRDGTIQSPFVGYLPTDQQFAQGSLKGNELSVRIVMSFSSLGIHPQHGPLDEYSELLLCDTLSLIPGDEDRMRRQEILGVDLGDSYRCSDGDQTKSRMASFITYYLAKSTDPLENVDDHSLYTRRVARQKLVEIMDSRTSHLLPAMSWIWLVLGSCWKWRQLEVFSADVLECISASHNADVQYLRPIIQAVLYLNKHPTVTDTTPRQNLSEIGLTEDFNRSVAYFDRQGRSNTADYAILQSYHAWYLYFTGDPEKALSVLLSNDCLPLASRLLGQYHIATVNCYRIAARCYGKLGNPLAESYIQEALVMLENCATPLKPYKYEVKRQKAFMCMNNGDLKTAITLFKEVVVFAYKTFGFAELTWSAVHELRNAMRDNNQHTEAEEMYLEYYQRYEDQWHESKQCSLDCPCDARRSVA